MNKINTRLLPLVLLLAAGFSGAAFAGCDTKIAVLEAKISSAETYNNTAKVTALKKALAEVKANCTDSAKLAAAEQKVANLEAKLANKKASLTEAEADLREAQAAGNAKKIAKYQKKVLEKQADVKEVTTELAKARATLAALQG
ncbi:DUF1090 family protein [Erwinia psidii]|uniref:DUF1090 family protein n=1 Tax=Erwinia psidii TaxID=69224 RepID=A0A3N6UKZ8_9GAMM|nr:DUF1090 family protein [Erwinia psidii]MCX8958755.1 DUF1090 family protein [Erwinia psidii]MCX8963035.1 DUF1090 family protein [Erwinia psidii]MCX8965904.1 DUF1090 family protein [Erwinia psidii]RQM36609.1 DUF1090 family protein [Erwinia psidii]